MKRGGDDGRESEKRTLEGIPAETIATAAHLGLERYNLVVRHVVPPLDLS